MAKSLSEQLRYIVPVINEKYVKAVFVNTAQEVFDWMGKQSYFTNRTYNLMDSVGVGIYKQGVLVKWVTNPGKKASGPREITYHGNRMSIDGRSLLQEAINASAAMAAVFADYTLVVFAKAPYGAWVDLGLGAYGGSDGRDGQSNPGKTGYGWWSDGLVPHVKDAFRREFNKVFNKQK